MSETLPRFGLPELNFLEVDATKTSNEIISTYERLSGRTLAQGDPVRLFLLSLADAIVQLRQSFNLAARQNLLPYATGEYLDYLGVFVNTYRLEPSYAVATVRFTLTAALNEVYVIPQGSRVTDGNYVFEVLETAEIPTGETSIEVIVQAQEAGTAYNGIAIGKINIMVDPLPNMASVSNIDVSAGGADRESDEAYANRIRLAPSAFSVAGPIDAYMYHTLSVSPSIINASIYGLQEHPGNVYIHPLLTGGELPSNTILQQIRDYLSQDTIRPLTDNLIVTAPKPIEYSIDATWYLDSKDIDRIAVITADVEAAVDGYRLWQQGEIGRDLNPDTLVEYVRKAGAKRIEIVTPTFTVLDKDEVARCPIANVNLKYGGAEDK